MFSVVLIHILIGRNSLKTYNHATPKGPQHASPSVLIPGAVASDTATTREEVADDVGLLQNNKATGIDGVTAEAWKAGGEVLCVLLTGTAILASESYVFQCRDETATVNETLVKEFKEKLPNLVYNEEYVSLAENYGVNGIKPKPKGDYLFVDEGGDFSASISVEEAVLEVLKTVISKIKEALKRRPGNRPYGCHVAKCYEEGGSEYLLQVACGVKYRLRRNKTSLKTGN